MQVTVALMGSIFGSFSFLVRDDFNSIVSYYRLLAVKHSIDFKIANITFHTLHCSQQAYLRSSLHVCHSTRSLRLSNTNLLSAPFVRTSFGSRSFSVTAPKIWNSLPPSLRTCTSFDTFRRHLKTHYCQQHRRPPTSSEHWMQYSLLLLLIENNWVIFCYAMLGWAPANAQPWLKSRHIGDIYAKVGGVIVRYSDITKPMFGLYLFVVFKMQNTHFWPSQLQQLKSGNQTN